MEKVLGYGLFLGAFVAVVYMLAASIWSAAPQDVKWQITNLQLLR